MHGIGRPRETSELRNGAFVFLELSRAKRYKEWPFVSAVVSLLMAIDLRSPSRRIVFMCRSSCQHSDDVLLGRDGWKCRMPGRARHPGNRRQLYTAFNSCVKIFAFLVRGGGGGEGSPETSDEGCEATMRHALVDIL